MVWYGMVWYGMVWYICEADLPRQYSYMVTR